VEGVLKSISLPKRIIRMSLVLFLAACHEAAFADCDALSEFASKNGVLVPSDDSGRVVTGAARLQFYSAPDYSCRLAGIFIIEGQAVNAYSEYREFTSVVYLGDKQGKPIIGWVRSNRLKPDGRGIAHVKE
jgi:hypothetical protein